MTNTGRSFGTLSLAFAALSISRAGIARRASPPRRVARSPISRWLRSPLPTLRLIAVVGGLGAPGHTLPTAHSGFGLARENVPVSSPGRIQIAKVRRVTYLSSRTREGERDYAVFFDVCEDVEGWLGHLVSLAPSIPDNAGGTGCETYSTSDETVESCEVDVDDFVLEAGDPLGTGGLSAARGFLALDFGLLDARVTNFYVTPSRYPIPTLHAVCPYEYFDAANQ